MLNVGEYHGAKSVGCAESGGMVQSAGLGRASDVLTSSSTVGATGVLEDTKMGIEFNSYAICMHVIFATRIFAIKIA